MPTKGEIWNVHLDPIQGHEQGKTRPCIVISNDQMNTKMNLSIVVPITGTPRYTKAGNLSPMLVYISAQEGGLEKDSYSMAFQVRTVSHSRLAHKRGKLSPAKLLEVVHSVQDIINF